MKKFKRAGILCAALLATTSCCTILTACGGDEATTPHKHDYATTWTADNSDHWHECKNASCDEKEKDKAPHDWDNGVITTEATASAAGVKTFTCTVCDKTKTEAVEYVAPIPSLTESTDFSALISDKVTEEQWKAAFAEAAFSNCTIKLDDSIKDSISILNIDKTETKDYRHMSTFIENDDGQLVEIITYDLAAFWCMENNIYTGYVYDYINNDFNTIYKQSLSLADLSTDDGLMEAINWQFSYKMMCPDFGEFFDKFSYDDTLHAYVCNDVITTNSIFESMARKYTDVVIKIVSGRLAYISLYGFGYEYDETIQDVVEVQDADATILFVYDHGTTQVTMPTNAIDYPEQEEEGPPYEE